MNEREILMVRVAGIYANGIFFVPSIWLVCRMVIAETDPPDPINLKIKYISGRNAPRNDVIKIPQRTIP